MIKALCRTADAVCMELERSGPIGLIDLSDPGSMGVNGDTSDPDLFDGINRRSELAPLDTLEEELDYDEFVFGVGHAAATMALAQVIASIAIAHWFNVTIAVQFWFDLIPHLAFNVPHRVLYVDIITWSMLATGGITLGAALFNWFVASYRTPQYAAGWRFALPMVAFLGLFNLLRHVLDPPTVSLWPLAQMMAATVACALLMVGLPSRAERKSQTSNQPKEQN